MLNGKDGDEPKEGFTTNTGTVATLVRRVFGTTAINCTPLTEVVASCVPLKVTTDPATKLFPFTVSVKVLEPTRMEAGESELKLARLPTVKILATEELPVWIESPL